jgi:hypothetical protein
MAMMVLSPSHDTSCNDRKTAALIGVLMLVLTVILTGVSIAILMVTVLAIVIVIELQDRREVRSDASCSHEPADVL